MGYWWIRQSARLSSISRWGQCWCGLPGSIMKLHRLSSFSASVSKFISCTGWLLFVCICKYHLDLRIQRRYWCLRCPGWKYGLYGPRQQNHFTFHVWGTSIMSPRVQMHKGGKGGSRKKYSNLLHFFFISLYIFLLHLNCFNDVFVFVFKRFIML